MDDPNSSKPLRDRLDALLKRAREISAEIERRVEAVTGGTEAAGALTPEGERGAPPAQGAPADAGEPTETETAKEAMSVAAEAVAVTAEAAAVTAEALTAIASERAMTDETGRPDVPGEASTTVSPEAAAVSPAAARPPAPSSAAPAPKPSAAPAEEAGPREPEDEP